VTPSLVRQDTRDYTYRPDSARGEDGDRDENEKGSERASSPGEELVKLRRRSSHTNTHSSVGKASLNAKGRHTLASAAEPASPAKECEEKESEREVSSESVGLGIASSTSVPSTPTSSVPTTPIISPRDSFSKAHGDLTRAPSGTSDTLDDIPLEQAEELLTLIRRPSQQRKVFRNFERAYSKKSHVDGEGGEGALSPSSSLTNLPSASGRPASTVVRANRTSTSSSKEAAETKEAPSHPSSPQSSSPPTPYAEKRAARSSGKKGGKRTPDHNAGMPLNFSNLFMQLDADAELPDRVPSLASLFDASSIGLAYDNLHNVKHRANSYARSYTDNEQETEQDDSYAMIIHRGFSFGFSFCFCKFSFVSFFVDLF
jgi:hypothetical protein